ncbi:metacaspase-9 [Gossypium raimondii]|nr:metacaspase-9 [Gossypium raimondii]
MATECKKRAVLVGCNYPNTINKLSGCVNDAKAMREMIVSRFGFDSENVELLTDEPESTYKPTRANIMAALKKMVVAAKEGDVLLFHFSGHGLVHRIDPHQPPNEGEAIVPCDLNPIFDVDLGQLIQLLPSGSSFTIVSDSCHSGGLIDKSKEQIGPHSTLRGIAPPVDYKTRGISLATLFQCLQTAANVIIATQDLFPTRALGNAINTGTDNMTGISSLLTTIFGNNVSLKFLPHYERDILNLRSLTEDEGILLSGCQANELSIDMPASEKTGGKAFGAFTYSVLKVIKESELGALTNRQLVVKARNEIIKLGIGQQHPCLYCSDGNADAAFLGHQPNTTTGA